MIELDDMVMRVYSRDPALIRVGKRRGLPCRTDVPHWSWGVAFVVWVGMENLYGLLDAVGDAGIVAYQNR